MFEHIQLSILVTYLSFHCIWLTALSDWPCASSSGSACRRKARNAPCLKPGWWGNLLLLFNNEILRNAPEKGGRRRKADKSCFRDNVRYSSRRLPAGWETKLQTRQHQAGKEASEWIKVWPMLYRKPSLGDRANSKDLRSWNNCQYTAKKGPPDKEFGTKEVTWGKLI